ncbi:MAG TPA: hypothetical protein VFX64_03790 [Candidatus Nitrosotalea sp.]|nr:hypothetical protein [Candidatus Nitrosotalea sp.]
MKTLHLTIIIVISIFLLACIQIRLATADTTNIFDTGMPPIIITQVEMWGPVSFYADGVKSCLDENTSLGPWAIGWVELYNTKNETMFVNDVDVKDGNGEGGYPQITLGPKEYCYLGTQGRLSTRIGVGGGLGNGAPIHDNATITISYSIQPFAGKLLFKYSTPRLSDDYGDTRTWQQVDGKWVFQEANLKHEFPVKRSMLSPSMQTQYGINAKDLNCKQGLAVVIKKSDPTNWYIPDSPSCVTISSASKLVDRGWGVPLQTVPIQDASSTLAYYAQGSKIDQIVPDFTTHGLDLSFETKSDSKLTLFVPRSFVDSQKIGDYASFNVTADGNKIDYREHLTPTDRVFTILFKNGTKNIQITPQPLTENQRY